MMHTPSSFRITLIQWYLTSLNFFIQANLISGLLGKGKNWNVWFNSWFVWNDYDTYSFQIMKNFKFLSCASVGTSKTDVVFTFSTVASKVGLRGGGHALNPVFGRSVNPISTKGGTLFPSLIMCPWISRPYDRSDK